MANIHSDNKMIFKIDREKPWFSWILIVFLFCTAWPLGLALLLYKLFSNDPKKSTQTPPPLRQDSPYQGQQVQRRIVYQQAEAAMKTPDQNEKNARMLVLAGIAVIVLAVLWCARQAAYLGQPDESHLGSLLQGLALLAGGAAMVVSGRTIHKGLKRYANYVAVVGDRDAMDVNQIARTLGETPAQVKKDLQAMIDRGYFGGKAYLNLELDYLFRSSDADEQFVKDRVAAKRAKAPLREVNKGYSELLENIHKANERIQDPEISAKIDRLEFITAKIFRAVNKDAQKARHMEVFLTYYLPTTQKLLDSYAEFESAGVEGENLRQAKQRIEDTMDSIVQGFERQLDALYASGGGKSTLCQLIPRFYDVTEGAVRIDGQDVRQVTQESLRRNIGVVQQDVFLFVDSIFENIRYGRPDATEAEVIAAAKQAEIYDDIMEMPDGFDTYVGERGTMLSGGQKQRISIARIFLKNPPVLILDEATSALDSVTEARIQATFDQLAKGRTTFIIAHRLSTVRNADRILVIRDGRIQEEGSHEALMAADGAYAALYRSQDLSHG